MITLDQDPTLHYLNVREGGEVIARINVPHPEANMEVFVPTTEAPGWKQIDVHGFVKRLKALRRTALEEFSAALVPWLTLGMADDGRLPSA